VNADGTLGIGTTTPGSSAVLGVNGGAFFAGNVKITGACVGCEVNFTNTSNMVRLSTTTNDVLLGALSTTSRAKLEVIAGSTNIAAYFAGTVGIGTTTPWAKLALQDAFGSV
jgi:hypothetical protein